MLKNKKEENRLPRSLVQEQVLKDDGNSKFVFGWDPNRWPGLLSNHFLDFGVDFLRCIALNNGWKKKQIK